jgi:ppGpp synthetase/RelA/SpoT-type nucleotidyltranferase
MADLIEQFIGRYRKEFDFYDTAARLAAQLLEQNLQEAGIRAIVTARAKSPNRLEQKVRQRDREKHYESVEDIFRDIVDLAGVRIALYFPGERDQVGKVITRLFAIEGEPKDFPGKPKDATYTKRFSGYWATHYRIRHFENSSNDAQNRYSVAPIEVQVASVLMHAWAEVEHDLIYKPIQGALSEDEYAILDELNGLVLSGEIALERLQRAGESRVAAKGRKFSNHYDLAAYLLSHSSGILDVANPEAILGRINLLFELLKETGKATPNALHPYLQSLTEYSDQRPIAEQIIDKLLLESPKRYEIYNRLRVQETGERVSLSSQAQTDSDAIHVSMGRFLDNWIKLERIVRKEAAFKFPQARFTLPTSSLVQNLNILDADSLAQLDQIRRFRNMLVHGIEIPSQSAIEDATHSLRLILEKLQPAGTSPRDRSTNVRQKKRRKKR